jgi:hypothetical protein
MYLLDLLLESDGSREKDGFSNTVGCLPTRYVRKATGILDHMLQAANRTMDLSLDGSTNGLSDQKSQGHQ